MKRATDSIVVRTQGYVGPIVCALIVAAIIGRLAADGSASSPIVWALLAAIVISAAVGIITSSLTIAIDDATIAWWFAFGVGRKRVALADVLEAGSRSSPIGFLGIGYRLWFGLRTFEVGTRTVVLLRTEKMRYRIGTHEAADVLDALAARGVPRAAKSERGGMAFAPATARATTLRQP